MEEEKKRGGVFLKTVLIVEFLIVAAMLFHFIIPARVHGESMMPTLEDGQCLIASVGVPKRGDIVLVDTGGQILVKRCVATAGESVGYGDGDVLINGDPLDEPYIMDGAHDYSDAWSGNVPDGCVFVLGDNRDHSMDSRVLGCIDLDEVLGVVRIILPGWIQF